MFCTDVIEGGSQLVSHTTKEAYVVHTTLLKPYLPVLLIAPRDEEDALAAATAIASWTAARELMRSDPLVCGPERSDQIMQACML
jgi:hypothetical protein